jgi:hypothetical protein
VRRLSSRCVSRRVLLGLLICLFPFGICAAGDGASSTTVPPANPPLPIMFAGITLIPQSKQPMACEDSFRGTLVLNHELKLCLCDGNSWVFESSRKGCAW